MKVVINHVLTSMLLFGAVINSSVCFAQVNIETNYADLSIQLIESIKSGNETKSIQARLENSTLESLEHQLVSDSDKIAFWINIYNGFIQLKLMEHPEYYENRKKFFKEPFIHIAGEQMSFADIEHGIIRGSQFEYFLGYLRNPFVARYKRRLRPDKMDYRIHFALNCGAKSCPPVRIYRSEILDAQLDQSADEFLETFTSYNSESNIVRTTALFSWFRGDFNGKKGTKKILKKFGQIPSTDVKLEYDDYDWTLDLGNYVD